MLARRGVVFYNEVVSSCTKVPSRTALTNLPRLDHRPLEPFDVQADGGQGGEQDDGLETSLLALVVLGLRGPVQERDDVLGHLGSGCGSAYP